MTDTLPITAPTSTPLPIAAPLLAPTASDASVTADSGVAGSAAAEATAADSAAAGAAAADHGVAATTAESNDGGPVAPAAPPQQPALADLGPAACAARLAALFPAVFGAGAVQPLKLRIQADIQQRAPATFTKKSLSVFLHRHTTNTAYLRALAGAAQRVDLDGLAAGDVADEHRQAALAELERRRASHEARRAAEREAQREANRSANEAARRSREADDEARQARATLLRAHETTTLTPKNFCALKGVAEAELDALLAQARQEREQRAQAPRFDPPGARPTQREPRPNDRSPRPARSGPPPHRDGPPGRPRRS